MKKFIALFIAAITVLGAITCFAGETTGHITSLYATTDEVDWGMTLEDFYASDLVTALLEDDSSIVALDSIDDGWNVPGMMVTVNNAAAHTVGGYCFLQLEDRGDYCFHTYEGYYDGEHLDAVLEVLDGIFTERLGEPFDSFEDEDGSVCRQWKDEDGNISILIKGDGIVYYQVSSAEAVKLSGTDVEDDAFAAAAEAAGGAPVSQARKK